MTTSLTLISTIYKIEPVIVCATRFSPSRIILLTEEKAPDEKARAEKMIIDTLGSVIRVDKKYSTCSKASGFEKVYYTVITEFHEALIVLIKRSWREEIKKTFDYDPLICPYCNTEMKLIGICYDGTESYPIDDPQPVKPPPNIKFSQQERIQLIISLIIENQNGREASIEKVVSEAVKRGIDKEQLLYDIQHLKDRGEVYEPKTGEIKYVF